VEELKITMFAATPSATVSTTAEVNPGRFAQLTEGRAHVSPGVSKTSSRVRCLHALFHCDWIAELQHRGSATLLRRHAAVDEILDSHFKMRLLLFLNIAIQLGATEEIADATEHGHFVFSRLLAAKSSHGVNGGGAASRNRCRK